MIICLLIKTGGQTVTNMDPEDPVRSRKPSSVSLLSGFHNVPISKSPLYLHQAGTN